jgi:glycosyltransferase involved in cell wall biosynthesis
MVTGRGVAYTSYYADLGGGELRLLEHLRLTRIPRPSLAVFVCEPGPLVSRVRELGIHAEVLAWNRATPRPWRTAQGLVAAARLGRHLRRHAVGALIANTYNDFLLAGPVARRLGIPVLWRSRADVFPSAQPLERPALARFVSGHAARVLTTTAYDRQAIVEAGVPPDRVHVVRQGVDTRAYDCADGSRRRAVRAALGLPPEALVVGFVARLVPQKGHLVFFEALERVVRKQPAVRALVVGDTQADGSDPDGYRSRLRRVVSDLGLAEQVTFTGFRDDVAHLLSAMDLFVHAALKEPFGTAIVEAMAAGKPVIASRTPGPEEIVEDGITGLLTPPGDALALAEAMLAVLGNNALGARLADAARAVARDRFDLRRTIADLDRHILEVAGET